MTERVRTAIAPHVAPLWALAAILMAGHDAWPAVAGLDLVRWATVLPLVLFWPGYVLAGIGGARGDRPAVIAFSVGLSLAVCVPAGLLLNGLGRLDPEGWIRALGAITILGWLAGLLLPKRQAAWGRPRISLGGVMGIGGFLGAGALAVIAVLMARDGALAQRQFHYTEFWMVPFDTPRRDLVTIGLNNAEGAATRYEIDVLMDGTLIGQLPPFTLAPGASRSFPFAVASSFGEAGRIEAWLYKDGVRDVIYRKVWVSPADVRSPGLEKG